MIQSWLISQSSVSVIRRRYIQKAAVPSHLASWHFDTCFVNFFFLNFCKVSWEINGVSHALLYQWWWKFYPVFSWLSSLGIAQSIILAKKKITIFPLTKSRIMPCHAIFPSSKNYQYFCILLKIPNLLLAKLSFRLSKKRIVHTHLFRKYSEFFQGLSSAILVFLFSYSLTKVISEKLLHN